MLMRTKRKLFPPKVRFAGRLGKFISIHSRVYPGVGQVGAGALTTRVRESSAERSVRLQL